MYFVATNVEVIDQKFNDDKALCRFEFFEILIRIAKGAYIETKKEKDLPVAFERLLKEKILPMYDTVYPWQRWRADPGLYTCCVNSVFEDNLTQLKSLFDVAQKKGRAQHLHRDVACSLFTKNDDIDLEVKKTQQAFGISKMTVVNEGTPEGQKEYKQARFVEFLEMIGRCAELKYSNETDSRNSYAVPAHNCDSGEPPNSSSMLKIRPDEDRINAPLEEKIFYIVEALLNADDPLSRAQSTLLVSRLSTMKKSLETDSSQSELESVLLSEAEAIKSKIAKKKKKTSSESNSGETDRPITKQSKKN